MTSLTTSLTSSGTFSMLVLFASARTHRITSLARLPSSIIHCAERRAAFRSGVPRFEPAQTGLGVGYDAGERLAHFMGDRDHQFAQACYARYVCELRLSIEEALFAGAQPLLRSVMSMTKETPSSGFHSKIARATSTGTRLPSLRKYSFSRDCTVRVAFSSAKAWSSTSRHSAGVRSFDLYAAGFC
jgi:hypothetical protein